MERQAISFARREKRGRKCYTLREREFIFFIFKLLNEEKKRKEATNCSCVITFLFFLYRRLSDQVTFIISSG